MIPITVSYFLKQAERRQKAAPALAAGTGTGITSAAPAAEDEGPAPHSPLLLAAIYFASGGPGTAPADFANMSVFP